MKVTCTYFWRFLIALVVKVITFSFDFIGHFDFCLFLFVPAWRPSLPPVTTALLCIGGYLSPLGSSLVGLLFNLS